MTSASASKSGRVSFTESETDLNASASSLSPKPSSQKTVRDSSELHASSSSLHSKPASTSWVSTRENCEFKWQRARGVVGALEVKSEPVFDCGAELSKHGTSSPRDRAFQEANEAWDELGLRQEFVRACESLPAEMCCFGLMKDHDTTKKALVPLLNENWVKTANKKLLEYGFKIDIFMWNWQNASGKAETNIMMIRFFELSSYRLRRASKGKDKLDEMMEEDLHDVAEVELQEMARS